MCLTTNLVEWKQTAPVHRTLSTNTEPIVDEDKSYSGNKQSFVESTINPGEWDASRTDPLHRPKYNSRAKIISKEDYMHQPSVSFEEQYDSFADAMVTLSWIDHDQQKQIYSLYLTWMKRTQETHGTTSHEYVCRLLGQRFDITPFRAAAIIQLQHNEEQYKLNEPDRLLCTEEAKLMDAYVKHTIQDAYRSTGEIPPDKFVEPVDPDGGMESYKTIAVDDLMDVDQLTRDANIREQEQARLLINEHLYIEDKDDEAQVIPLSKDTKRWVKQNEELAQKAKSAKHSPTAEAAAKQKDSPRPRWKFVAQTIDTKELDPRSKFSHYKDGKRLRGRKHRMRFQQNWAENTIIEEDGKLRAANLAEVKQTSWKPVRHVQEFTYGTLKKGWLDKTVRNKENAWGKKDTVAELLKPEEAEEDGRKGKEVKAVVLEESGAEDKDDTDLSSSDSDGVGGDDISSNNESGNDNGSEREESSDESDDDSAKKEEDSKDGEKK